MNLRLQESVVTDTGAGRSYVVRTSYAGRVVIVALSGIVIIGAATRFANLSLPAMALVDVCAVAVACLFAFNRTETLVDTSNRVIVKRGITAARPIPFDQIKLVSISDSGTMARGDAGPGQLRVTILSVSVEVTGKHHPIPLITGVPGDVLVREAREIAELVGKPVYVPDHLSALVDGLGPRE